MAMRRAVSALAVAVMAAAAFVMLDAGMPWVGDWTGPVWLVSGGFFPFLFGMAAGPRLGGVWQPPAGALLGALVFALPGALMLAAGELAIRTYFGDWEGRDYGGWSMAAMFAAGIAAAGGFGAVTLPVGVSANARLRRRKDGA